MKKKSIISLLALFLVIGIFITGCTSPDSGESEEASGSNDDKTFVVGLDDSFPPMGFRDEKNEIVGFDVDLAKEVGKRMGMEVVLQQINWDTKELELDSGNIDVIWNGLTMTDERVKVMDFTDPYLENDQVIVVKKDSDIKVKADLAGKNVGVQKARRPLKLLARMPSAKKQPALMNTRKMSRPLVTWELAELMP